MLEGWLTPINPAIERARQEYKKFKDDKIIKELKKRKWREYIHCSACKQLFLTVTMLHVPTVTHNKGKKVTNWRHYCQKCQRTYKPYNQ